MIRLYPGTLPNKAADDLTKWTQALLSEPTFDDRVTEAKAKFSSRNKKGAKTFDAIKVALYAMCNHTHRCVYCEDNFADEVEHIRPKDLYPELCFAWSNYVYACGPCNGPKNNHFAVIDAAGVEHDLTPPRTNKKPRPPRLPPVPGSPLMIDPRVEDPLYFLALDLDTGGLAPHPLRTKAEQRRAEWTRDTLGLNRGRLPRARVDERHRLVNDLNAYANARDSGAAQGDLDTRKARILRVNHRTVLFEMVRQRAAYADVQAVFDRVPEAVGWVPALP